MEKRPLCEFVIEEPLNRDWQAEWLSFAFSLPPGACEPDSLRLFSESRPDLDQCFSVESLHPDGSVAAAVAHAYTGLDAGETVSFEVVRGARVQQQRLVEVAAPGDGTLLLRSDRLELRVPDGTKPLPPTLGVRRPGGEWLCASAFDSVPECRLVSVSTDRSSAHKLIHRMAYELAGGRYEIEVEMTVREDVVLVREGFPEVATGELRLDLFTGLEPQYGHWRFHRAGKTRGAGKRGNVSYRISFAREGFHILQPFYHWHADIGVWWGAYRKGGGYLGLFMMRPSEWSNPEPNRACIRAAPGPELEARLPFRKGARRWGILLCETADAQVEDPNALCRMQRELVRWGENGLDKVKDLALQCGEAASAAHPHLLCRPEDVTTIRAKAATDPLFARILRNHPEKPEDPAGLFLATGDPRDDRAAAEAVLSGLRAMVDRFLGSGYSDGNNVAIASTRPIRSLAMAYDAAAAGSALGPEERDWCIRAFAFLAHCLADENCWPREDQGFCRGNINFHSDHYTALAAVAGLLVGHPKRADWMRYVEEQMELEFERNVFPGGAWVEAPNYQGYTMHYLILAARVLQLNGYRDFSGHAGFRATMDYLSRIQTPKDVRAGHHMLPTVGDTTAWYHSQGLQVVFAWMASLTREDREFSGKMMRAWRRGGGFVIGAHDIGLGSGWHYALALVDPSIEEAPAESSLASERLPGYGALLRDRNGSEDEDYFLFKAGAATQHFDADEGGFHWYAKGRPLSLDFGCMYAPSIEQPWLQNTVSFGRKRIWNNMEFTAFASFGGADFVRAECAVTSLQKVEELPGRPHPPWHRDAPIEWDAYDIYWRREVLFVKGPGYVVIRDDISNARGSTPTDWSLNVLAESAQIEGPLASFVGQHGVDLEVYVAEPLKARIRTSEWGHPGQEIEQWFADFELKRMAEWQITLTATCKTSGSYLVAMVPYEHGQAMPNIRGLGNGVLRIEHGGGVDLVFFAKSPGAFEAEGVRFHGRVGLVRRTLGGTEIWIMDGACVRTAEFTARLGGPSSVRVEGFHAEGELDGEPRTCSISWREPRPERARLTLDRRHVSTPAGYGQEVIFTVVGGRHRFEVA